MADEHRQRPVYTNIHVSQIVAYRLPPAGWVSILHRISGALMFVLLPLVVWLLDVSLTSEISYERFSNAFIAGIGIVPAFLLKLIVLALIWSFLHHLIAGMRHLWMDVMHNVTLRQGHISALITFGVSGVLTLVLGARLFGLY
jgi:succinate dehydrogenase / fumarate reductase cytochrome b subunit